MFGNGARTGMPLILIIWLQIHEAQKMETKKFVVAVVGMTKEKTVEYQDVKQETHLQRMHILVLDLYYKHLMF